MGEREGEKEREREGEKERDTETEREREREREREGMVREREDPKLCGCERGGGDVHNALVAVAVAAGEESEEERG